MTTTDQHLAAIRRLLASCRRWLIWLGVFAMLQIAAACVEWLVTIEPYPAP